MGGAADINAKGAVFRLFGVVLLSLGALNAMLSWRGGASLGGFHLALFGAGLFLFAIGAIRRAITEKAR